MTSLRASKRFLRVWRLAPRARENRASATVRGICGRRRIRATAVSFLLLVMLMAPVGCVRRTLTITTEPPHALVFLNDQEIGRTPVSTDFVWYGDYDVIIRKEGFETLKTHWRIDPPWYQVMPLDFCAEVLWPAHVHDQRARHFDLIQAEPTPAQELIGRARETRDRALDPRK